MGNTYDSYAIRLKMRIDLNDIEVYKMVDFKGKDFTEEVKLKTD